MSVYKYCYKYNLTSHILQNYPYKNTTKQTRKPQNNEIKSHQGFWMFFKKVFDKFAENSTIHGVDKILKSDVNNYKRFLWFCFFIISMLIFSYASYELISVERENPMKTFVSITHYPVYKIPFPVVTICNKNRLNWQRYESAKDKFLNTLHHSEKYEDIFNEVLNAYDTLTFGEFHKFENLTKLSTSLLQELNYINFTLVAEFMSWKCYEIFADCKWLNQPYNCCDIFLKRNSQMGSCLAFNAVESEEGRIKKVLDPYWPWRTKGEGIQNGLQVKVYMRESLHSPKSNNHKGLVFMITEPYIWYYNPIDINRHSRADVSLSASLSFLDDYTRYYSSDERKCVFEDELNSLYYKSLQGHPYMFENCQAECQQEYLMKYCNCTVDLFYPPGQYNSCKLSDLPCLHENNDKLQYFEQVHENEYVPEPSTDIMKCPCYFNCKSLSYGKNVNAAYMSNIEPDLNNTFIDMSFFFSKNTIMVYQTTVTYTWTDLMVGFGGLAVLCIGISLLSVAELIYLIFVDVPQRIYCYFKARKVSYLPRKSRITKSDFVRDIIN